MKLRRKIMPNAKAFDVLWDLDGETLLFFGHSSKLLLDFSALLRKNLWVTARGRLSVFFGHAKRFTERIEEAIARS